ncbi:MAG: coenzyme F420-0:L-glutamate ligase [Acutalibacteraceae bacterium]|jgi:F420-0:gamma-glutamyl ligase-like protein
MEEKSLMPNEGKNLDITTEYGTFSRFPVKTHVIMAGDNLNEVMDKYVKPHLKDGDMIFISEKIVAISQGRAFRIDDIKPGRMAKFLSRFVQKTSYGIGLGSPWTMQLAIDDIGRPKILFAALCSALTKPFGIRGVFYNIVGTKGRAIDGPCDYTLPPYNRYAKLAPEDPDKVARSLKEHTGHSVAVVDANDIACNMLGRSDESIDAEMCAAIFSDNPLGQSSQQTPIGIVRKIS